MKTININNNFIKIVKFILLLFLLSADISKSIGIQNISFYVVLVISLILICNDSIKKKNKFVYLKAEYLIYISIIIISFFIILLSSNTSNIIHGIKLLLVFFVIYPTLRSFYSKKELIKYLKYLLLINLSFIVLGIFGVEVLSTETGLNRGSTFLNYAGTLYKVGLIIIPYLLVDLIYVKKNNTTNIILLILSIIVIAYDGSRTGFFSIMIIAFFFVLVAVFSFLKRLKLSLKTTLFHMTAFSIVSIIIFWNIDRFQSWNALSRSFDTIAMLFTLDFDQFLLYGDTIRGQMILDGIDTIKSGGFIVGQGFLSTQTSNFVVHNAYIQIFADLGFFALLGMIALLISPIFYGLKRLKIDKTLLSSISLIGIYAFTWLLHPLSVQPTDWALYLIPVVIIFNSNGKQINNNN